MFPKHGGDRDVPGAPGPGVPARRGAHGFLAAGCKTTAVIRKENSYFLSLAKAG